MPNLKSAPTLNVHTNETPMYQQMGFGQHLNLFLLGHADGIPLNSPIQVTSVRDAVDILNQDTSSPLLKGLLEAYYAGARDIWIMAVAPMSEVYDIHEDEPVAGSEMASLQEYDETYKARLDDAYSILENWDLAHMVVPIGAVLNDYDSKVDYLTQLGAFCYRAGYKSGGVHLGFLGTRGPVNEELVNAISEDRRIEGSLSEATMDHFAANISDRWSSMLKNVSVFAGDVLYNIRELPVAHRSSAVIGVAGLLSQGGMGYSVTNKLIPNAVRVLDYDIDQYDMDRLSSMGVNLVAPDHSGRRGNPFRVRALTDNTLAEEDSIFWSLTQMAATTMLARDVRSIGLSYIGSGQIQLLDNSVRQYLTSLVNDSYIREYSVQIARDPVEYTKVNIDLSFKPFFSIRHVSVNVSVGPNKL